MIQSSAFFSVDLLETAQVQMFHRFMNKEAQVILPQFFLHRGRHEIPLFWRVRQKSSHDSLSALSCSQLQVSSHAPSKAPEGFSAAKSRESTRIKKRNGINS